MNRKLAILLLAVAVVFYTSLCFSFRSFVIDDTYITFRYADNLARGGAVSFNPDDAVPVDGYTSFLWMLFSALFIRIGADPTIPIRLLGFAAGLASIFMLYRLGRLIFGNSPAALLPPLLLAASAEFSEWSVSGMESPLFVLLLLSSLYLLIREAKEDRRPLSSVLFALLALCRPEGVAFFLVALLFRLVSAGRAGEPWRRAVRSSVPAVVVFALVYGPYFAWHCLYYDSLLPNSYYAKEKAMGGANYIAVFLGYMSPLLIVSLAAYLYSRIRIPRVQISMWPLLFLTIQITNFAGVWNINPVMSWDWRLFLHLQPLIYLLLAGSLSLLWENGVRVARVCVIVLSLGCLAWCAHFEELEARLQHARSYGEGLEKAHIQLGRWMRENLPAHTVVALVDSGAIPFYSRLRAVDIANIPLNNKALARGGDPVAVTWAEEPELFILAGDAPSKIISHEGRDGILREARRRNYSVKMNIEFREDYFLILYASPDLALQADTEG